MPVLSIAVEGETGSPAPAAVTVRPARPGTKLELKSARPGAKLEPQPVASRTGVMMVAACDCVAAPLAALWWRLSLVTSGPGVSLPVAGRPSRG